MPKRRAISFSSAPRRPAGSAIGRKRVLIVNVFLDEYRRLGGSPFRVPRAMGPVYLAGAFTRLGLEYIPSVGNFITVALPRPGREIYEQLLRAGIIVRAVDNYGLPDHLRISVGLESENRRFIQSLSEILQ